MFDLVQENKRFVQVLLALIVLPFAFWGVDSYNKSDGNAALATVNGQQISAQEFDNTVQQQLQKMRELAGPTFEASFFEKPEIKFSVLEGLVAQRLLAIEATEHGLSVSDDQLAEVIASIGAFQTDGKFDSQQYQRVLNSQNMTPAIFEAKVRRELSTRQLTDAYTQNGYAAQTSIDHLIRLNERQHTISVAKIDLNTLLAQIKISDAAIAEYYQKNQSEFQTPERAEVEYVVLSAETLAAQASIDEAEIKKYYSEHSAEFGTQEQRQAAHILISVSAQATPAEQQSAKAKAEEILKKVQQSPNDFAALAKQFSQDPGSAANGGDLGLFARGSMVKPFEEAAFKLKPNEISNLVQSDFGYHIIRLIAIKPALIQPFAEVRAGIEQKMRAQKAVDQFAELAEKFSNTAYEQSDSLQPAAALIKAKIQPAIWLTKGQTAAGIWTAKALQAIFSDEVLKNKRNSAAVEVAPNVLLAVRAIKHQPASVKPLAEVSAAIQQKLQQQQALTLAGKQGSEALALLQSGKPSNNLTWQTAQTVTRVQHTGLNEALAQLAFQANANKFPAYVGVQTANGYELARIEAVKEVTTIDEAKRAQIRQQLAQMTGNELLQAYLTEAKKGAKIHIKPFPVETRP
jgi:peptidyl-prolyl cis-trans isomerase D